MNKAIYSQYEQDVFFRISTISTALPSDISYMKKFIDRMQESDKGSFDFESNRAIAQGLALSLEKTSKELKGLLKELK